MLNIYIYISTFGGPEFRQWPVSHAVVQILAVAGQPGCPVSQVARALRRSVSQGSKVLAVAGQPRGQGPEAVGQPGCLEVSNSLGAFSGRSTAKT